MFYCRKCRKFHEGDEYDSFGVLPACPVCGSRMTPTPAIGYGTKISGFIVQHELGRGAVGAVYLAKQCNADVFVAIKVLLPSSMKDEKFADDFFREARAAAALNHPNIVHAQDAGITDEGICYFIMEFIEGENLEEKLEKNGPLPMLETLDTACCISDALAYAWRSQRLCHGDIKPENIIVRPDGVVKLADLGLAKDYKNGVQASSEREIMATPAYAPPEVIRGEINRISFKSDMYSFGETLYHLLTGTPPFPGDDAAAVCSMQLNNQPPPVIAVNEEAPEKLSMLVDVLMEKSPDKRPNSWDDVRDRLEEIRNDWIGSHVKKAKPVNTGVRLLSDDDDEKKDEEDDAALEKAVGSDGQGQSGSKQDKKVRRRRIFILKQGSSTFTVAAAVILAHLIIIAIFCIVFCELREPGYLKKTYNGAKTALLGLLNGREIESSSTPDGKEEAGEPQENEVSSEKLMPDAPELEKKTELPAEEKAFIEEKEKSAAATAAAEKKRPDDPEIKRLCAMREKIFSEMKESTYLKRRSEVFERRKSIKDFLKETDACGNAELVLSQSERKSMENYDAQLEKLIVSHPAPKQLKELLEYARKKTYLKEKSTAALKNQKEKIERMLFRNGEISSGGFLTQSEEDLLKRTIVQIDDRKASLEKDAAETKKENARLEARNFIMSSIKSCSTANEAGTRKLLSELDYCEKKYQDVMTETELAVIRDVRELCKDAWTGLDVIVKEEIGNLKGFEIMPKELPGYKVESADKTRIKVMLNASGAKVYSYVRFSELNAQGQYTLASRLAHSNHLKKLSVKNQRILLKRILLSGRSPDNAAAKFRRSSGIPEREIDALVNTAKFLHQE